MNGRSAIDDATSVIDEETIAALAAQMAKVVIDFESRAADVRAQIEHKIANGRAVRWRKLDELHDVLSKAKASAGKALERVEFQRRKNIEVILVDGIPAAFVSVSDGITDDFREKIGLYRFSSGEWAGWGGAKEILRRTDFPGDLNSTVDLIGAFVALMLAEPSRDNRHDYTSVCRTADERMF